MKEETRKIDVTKAAHEAAHEYTKGREGVTVKGWVSALILRTLEKLDEAKKLEKLERERDDDLWIQPPFWEQRRR